MSTRASIFLTKDKGEHCYYETIERDDDNRVPIYLEMDKSNIEIDCNDESDLIVKILPGSELYSLIASIKQK